jgi:hypothetical protein
METPRIVSFHTHTSVRITHFPMHKSKPLQTDKSFRNGLIIRKQNDKTIVLRILNYFFIIA